MRKLYNALVDYKKKFGLHALVRLMFFPVTLVYFNAIRLISSIWNARILAEGRWSQFNRFRATSALNSLFYWTQAINFDRFGRAGNSDFVGTGNYNLGQWWHASIASTHLYWKTGAVMPFFSMLVWLGSYTVWLSTDLVSFGWLAVVMVFAFLSSIFYAGAFVVLNYNAMGWAFMPIGLFALVTDNYLLSAFVWLGASLGSLTVVFIAGSIGFVWSIQRMDLLPLLAFFPAGIKLASHLLYSESISSTLKKTAAGIGLFSGAPVKYVRKDLRSRLSIIELYLLSTFITFTVLTYYRLPDLCVLPSTVTILYLINRKVARFADAQSLYLAMFSVATTVVLMTQDVWLLISYWLVISPLPVFIGSGEPNRPFDKPEPYRPFHIQPLIDKCSDFLEGIEPKSRVLLGLNNPNRNYDEIFDGYRVIYELVFYVGNLRNILVFPDWWAIFSNNQIESPEFWVESPRDANKRLEQWQAGYILVYQEDNESLDPEWEKEGFSVVSVLSWVELLENELRNERCWPDNKEAPIWWLLKKTSSRDQVVLGR